MKKIFHPLLLRVIATFSFFFFSFSFIHNAYSQTFQWAKRGGGALADGGNNIVVDAQGNSYVVGYFNDVADFDGTTVTSNGSADIFVAKYNANGNLLWVVKGGGTGDDNGLGISLDNLGNAYVTGYFKGTASFGSSAVTSNGDQDAFIAKCTPNGQWVWAVNGGGIYDENGTAITTDAAGNSYITGFFSGAVTFGGFSENSYGVTDIFIAKCDAAGNWIWLTHAGNGGYDAGNGISSDNSGNIFVTGYYGDYFGFPVYFGNNILYGDGNNDPFIAKYNSAGTCLWARNGVCPSGGNGTDVKTDPNGNAYLLGVFNTAITFGSASLNSVGSDDYFFVKYDPSGNVQWAQQMGGTGFFKGNGLSAGQNNEVYVTGTFDGTASIGGTLLTSSGFDNIFIAKFNTSGALTWAKKADGSYYHIAMGIGDQEGNAYITGFFSGTVTFEDTMLISNPPSGFYSDMYITKLSDFLSTGTITPISLCTGTSINVPYSSKIFYNTGNVLTAQFSDASGNFATPVNIGTLNSTDTIGAINATIPASTAASTNYRIRVKASDPLTKGANNGSSLTVNLSPAADAGNDTTIFAGQSVQIGNNPIAGIIYSWLPATGLDNASVANPTASPTITTTYTLNITNINGCTTTDFINVIVIDLLGSSCANAIDLGQGDTTIQNITMTDSVMWFRFVADSDKKLTIAIINPSDTNISHVNNIYLYEDCITNYVAHSRFINLAQSDSLLTLHKDSLVSGKEYFIKTQKDSPANAVMSLYILMTAPCTTAAIPCDLVFNGNFETKSSCPYLYASVLPIYEINDLACNWFDGSTDYYHTCSSIAQASVPNNSGGSQSAYSGQAYAGEYALSTNFAQYREYIKQKLVTPLVAGKTYFFSMRMNLADNSTRASNGLGVLFTNGAPTMPNGIQTSFPYTPQIPNSISALYNDKNNWVLFSGCYTPTISGQNYLTIGNFRPDNQSNNIPVSGGNANFRPGAYYFIDDVSLQSLADAGPDIITCSGGIIGPPCVIPGATYSWLPTTGLSNPNIPNPIATPGVTTTYTLTVTFPNSGCSATDVVTVIGFPSVTINAFPGTTICTGQNVLLVASVTGGTAPYTYQWSTGAVTPNITVNPASTTNYVVTVTDANGCTSSAQTTITVNPLPIVIANANPTQICLGQSTALSASGAVSYLWSGNNLTCPTCTTNVYPPLGNNIYTVIGTDANGCTNSAQVTVSVNPNPISSFTFPANSLCINTPIQFTYTGTGATSWSWNFGDPLSTPSQNVSTLQNPTHTYTSPGQFQVYVTTTGASGCQAVFAQILNIASDCCALTVAYDDAIVPSILPAGLTTWNVNYKLNKTITVPANAILEIPIGRTIEFGPFGKIILENGNPSNQAGFLVMRTTSKFTNIPACPTMWQGVEVWGVSTQPSSSYQQGKIYMDGSATIENAHIGVLLGKTNACFPAPPPPCYNPPCPIPICFQPFGPYDLSKSGGVIDADGAKFNKNGTCVQFLYYTQVNTSNIRNSILTGGVLLDPGYKTGNSYTYPNAANPYYSPHTFLGNGPRLAYLWGVRDVTFTDNTFKDSPKGIQENNAKCKVLKASGTGNKFQSLGYGIYAQYYNTSNILFGNTVDGNTFNPTTQAIYISGGQGDRITNNEFGDKFNLTLSQSVNNVGIYMHNSSAYTILDNDFWRHLVSILLNYSPSLINTSPTSVIANKIADRGNFFTQCGYSILSVGDNRPVILHCNTTENNSTTPSDYLNNWSGLFGTQGILSTTDYTKPAGNRFDWPAPFTKRQIATPTPYSYYAHGNPSTEYQPIPSIVSVLNTNSIACPSHLQCCTATSYIILNPSSEYYRQYISNIDQQIINLQTEFNTVFSTLDKGQTAQLLTAINGNTSNGNLKNMLLQNSPLSDEVLNAFINKNGTPPGNFKVVVIPNSPVTENIRPILESKLNSLPAGIAKQVGAEQTNVTNRTIGSIAQDIKVAKTERSVYLNQLMAFYVEKDSIQKAIDLLEQEHTTTADQTLLATYISDSNFVAAQQKLTGMTATNSAEQAYLDLQEMLLILSLQGKSVFAMDSVQELMVRNIASADYGLASSNACAILSLVFNEECPVQLSTSREQQPFVIASEAMQYQIDYLGDNIPNPFNNTTVIPYTLPEDAEKAHINIYDVTGKLISNNEVTNKNNMLTISANNFECGVYIYKLEMNGEIIGNKKMIIIKE